MPTVLAAGKCDTFEYDLLRLIFNGTTITGIASNVSAGAYTNYYVSLHTAYLAEDATANISETTYTGYARVAVPRTTGGWTVNATTGTVSPVDPIVFGQCTAGTATIVAFAISIGPTSTSKILYRGYVNPPISVSAGVTPTLGLGTFVGED